MKGLMVIRILLAVIAVSIFMAEALFSGLNGIEVDLSRIAIALILSLFSHCFSLLIYMRRKYLESLKSL